jgi:hypothetical protein
MNISSSNSPEHINIPPATEVRDMYSHTHLKEAKRAVDLLIHSINSNKYITIDGVSNQWVDVPKPYLSSQAISHLQSLGYDYITTYRTLLDGEIIVSYAIRVKSTI